jgi:hypothetical protein
MEYELHDQKILSFGQSFCFANGHLFGKSEGYTFGF